MNSVVRHTEKFWIETLKGAQFNKIYGYTDAFLTRNLPLDSLAVHTVTLDQMAVELVNKVGKNLVWSKYVIFLAVLKLVSWKLAGKKDIPVATGAMWQEKAGQMGFFYVYDEIGAQEEIKKFFGRVKDEVFRGLSQPLTDISQFIGWYEKMEAGEVKALQHVSFAYNLTLTQPLPACFALKLAVEETGDQVRVHLHYQPALCTAQQAAAFLECYLTGLYQALADVNQPAGAVPILPGHLQQQLRGQGKGIGLPVQQNLLQLFAAQVQQHPDRVAVRCEAHQVSYGFLDARTSAIALCLRQAAGPVRNPLIGLYTAKSEWMIMGYLGILKAGGAIVPLEPSLPRNRIKAILEDCNPQVVLTDAHCCPDVEAVWPGKTLVLERAESGAVYAEPTLSPQDIAYLIYTSGSTGNPKAIVQTHACLANVALSQQHHDGFPTGLRISQFTPLTFDVSIGHEIAFSLASGGTMEVAPEDVRGDLAALAGYVLRRRIEWIYLTASALNSTVEETAALWHCSSFLKYIVTGAEAFVIGNKLAAFLDQFPTVKVVNFYGPSETHYITSELAVPDPVTRTFEVVQPIGVPVLNAGLLILDEALAMVPPGVPGELYASGPGVARGYLNNPELTAERFVVLPDDPARVYYRTGDLARWRPDGKIDFLGRFDTQVKLHGHRIELTEVEAHLLRVPGVRQGVVIKWSNPRGGDCLVAFLTADRLIEPGEIMDQLRRHLPAYQVPGIYIFLDELPRNKHGKTDRQQLAQLVQLRRAQETIVLPESPAEKQLAAIWETVLGIEKAGLHDNFFELGGNSVNGLRFVSLVHRDMAIDLELRVLFERQTIKELGRLVESLRQQNGSRVEEEKMII